MTVGKGEASRSRCCGYDGKFHPILFCKGAVLIVIGPLVFYAALLAQAGMLRSNSAREQWEIVFGAASSSPTSDGIGVHYIKSNSDPVSSRYKNAADCLSRTQNMLHRPSSQVISASPALVSALIAYEKRHAECSGSLGRNWTETFLRSMDQGVDIDNPSNCKFLLYVEGGAGLGNRIISLVSAFLYALLTDRVLLLDSSQDKGHLANMLCEPLPDSSWLLPPQFPMQQVLNQAPNLGDAIGRQFINLSVLQLMLEHDQSWSDQQFFCTEIREAIMKITWVTWTSNQYFVPRLFTFPEFWPQLSTLFPNASHAFTHLSRYLILPNNVLWERIFRIHSSYLSSTEKLVGIQIRRHSVPSTGDYSPDAFKRVFECLTAHRILPNYNLSTSTDTKSSLPNNRILELMGTTDRQREQQPKPTIPSVTTVLIASLQQRYTEELQDLYTNYPTTNGELVRVHMVTHDGLEWHSFDQAQKALVEMWLLSLSDYLVTSAWSTFGYVAHGLGGLRPYIVNLRGDLDLNAEDHIRDDAFPTLHCKVGNSPEPCNHYPFWPKTDCSNERESSPAHEKWLAKHFRPCSDEPAGRQLIT